MPETFSLEELENKHRSLEEFEKMHGAGQPTTAQQDYTVKKAVQKSREQLVQEHRANLAQSVPENERVMANVNLRPELQIEEQPQGGMLDTLGGAWKSTVSPLVGMAKAGWQDITNPGQTNLADAMIINPIQETFKKAMDPNRSGSERLVHGGLSLVPFAGPMVSDWAERVLPKQVYGTGPERKEALGETIGPVAAPAVLKGVKTLRRAGAEKKFGQAAAKIADSTGGELNQLEVENALHLLDDQFKKEFGTVGTKGKEKPAIDLRHVNPEEVKDLSIEAKTGYYEKNVKPIETLLGNMVADGTPAFNNAKSTLGILGDKNIAAEFQAQLKKQRPLTEWIQLRTEINGLLKAQHGLSNLDYNSFIRSHPRGRFLFTALEGIRELIDNTIDANAGQYAGQMKGVLTDFASLTDLSDALQRGAERSAAIKTAQNAQTMIEKAPIIGAAAGSTAGLWGSKSRAIEGASRMKRMAAGAPEARIHQAGKKLEQSSWFGLIPPGRRAMSPVPEINWSPAIGNVSPQNPLNPPPGGTPPPPPPPFGKIPGPVQPPPGSAPPAPVSARAGRQVIDSEAVETTPERRVKSPVKDSESVRAVKPAPVKEEIPVVQPRARKKILPPDVEYQGEMLGLDQYKLKDSGGNFSVKKGEKFEDKYKAAKESFAPKKVEVTEKKEIKPEVVAKMKEKLAASKKAKVEKETAKAIASISDMPPPPKPKKETKLPPEKNVPSYWDKLKEEKPLGGTTGAKLYKHPDTETRFVVKHGQSEKHVANEVEAGKLYKLLGVPTPEISMQTVGGKNAAVSSYFQGMKTLGQVADKKKHYKEIQKGFVADALLGNWDSIGKEFDNILVSENPGVPIYRIDPAGSLRFRAQGKEKSLSPIVGEIESLRDPVTNPQAAEVFKGIRDKDIAEQIKQILPKEAEFMKTIGSDLHPIMKERFKDLKSRLENIESTEAMKVKAPPTGTVKKSGSAPHLIIKPLENASKWVIKDDAGKTYKTINVPGPEGSVKAKAFAKKLMETLKEED